MNRLKTAKSTATTGSDCWGLDYTYDRYANLTNAAISSDRGGSGCSAPTLSLAVSTSTNKITSSGFTYDAAGNLTSDGTASYTWNAEGRMASTAGMNYTYDGDGKRAKKAAGSPSSADRLYWYGINGEVLAESDWGGTLVSEYIYFGGTRIARRDVSGGAVYYYLPDRLGTARVMTNASGTVVEESDMYPFGQERVITDNLDNNYKYTGHERDTESGLDHTLHRQLSSSLGRWLSTDSAPGDTANPQSWNRYPYAMNSPTNGVDPDGRLTIVVAGTGGSCESDFYQMDSDFWAAIKDTFHEDRDEAYQCLDWSSSVFDYLTDYEKGLDDIVNGAFDLSDRINGWNF
jgi:RHS repeat-associated protein